MQRMNSNAKSQQMEEQLRNLCKNRRMRPIKKPHSSVFCAKRLKKSLKFKLLYEFTLLFSGKSSMIKKCKKQNCI